MRIGKKHVASAAIAIALTLGATQAQASTELITNGSFETGDLTGWSSDSAFGLNGFGTTYGSGMDGTYWHWLSGYEYPITTSQTVSGLTAGTTYNLTFIMASEASNQDSLRLSVNGGPGSIFTAPAYSGPGNFWDTWVSQSYSFVATGSSATIQFDTIGLNGSCCDVGLDKVSLLAANGAVPEPTTWAMMLLGFGMAGFGLRNRRKPTVRVTYA